MWESLEDINGQKFWHKHENFLWHVACPTFFINIHMCFISVFKYKQIRLIVQSDTICNLRDFSPDALS